MNHSERPAREVRTRPEDSRDKRAHTERTTGSDRATGADDLPIAGDDLRPIVGLPRPQGRIPAPIVQFLELIRSDTYMALGAAIAASLVLLLVTTALLKAC